MLRLVRNAWIRALIAFDVRDPIVRTEQAFELPENFDRLPRSLQVRVTICNLFANHKHPVDHLARLYEMSPAEVISLLLAEGLLEDKRQYPVKAIKGGRRETDH